MAEQEPTQTDESTPSENERVGRGTDVLGKVKVLVFLLAVILVECVAAYLIIPSAADTAAMAQAMLAADGGAADRMEQDAVAKADEEIARIEVGLGDYSITSFQPNSSITLRIDFQLYATVLEDEADDFQLRFDENQRRLRDQVIVTVRSSEETDLADPGLGLIKRKILETSNRALGKPILQEIIFSDFSLVEQ